jgi:hypothetical protein
VDTCAVAGIFGIGIVYHFHTNPCDYQCEMESRSQKGFHADDHYTGFTVFHRDDGVDLHNYNLSARNPVISADNTLCSIGRFTFCNNDMGINRCQP